jgi:hypothetical protein
MVATFERTPAHSALQLPADHYLAGAINAMDLKHRLGDIETDCRNRLHVGLL